MNNSTSRSDSRRPDHIGSETIVACDDDRVLDAGVLLEQCHDLRRFHAEPANLDLLVDASHENDVPVLQTLRSIAGPVDASGVPNGRSEKSSKFVVQITASHRRRRRCTDRRRHRAAPVAARHPSM